MSVLQARPVVAFDPSNMQHRAHYNDFINHASWSRCPVQFILEDNASDVVTMIQRTLLVYYTEQEFSKNVLKMVDNTAVV